MSSGLRSSSRASKPPGFFKAMAEGKEYEGPSSVEEEEEKEVSTDEELIELRKLEQEKAGELAKTKKKVKEKRSERLEEEKRLLRERIEEIDKQTAQLKSELFNSDSRSRHTSRSLPDTSEYQKLLRGITLEEKLQKSKSKAKKTRASRYKRHEKQGLKSNESKKELAGLIKQCFVDEDGDVKIPSTGELKKLVSIAESTDSKDSPLNDSRKMDSADSSADSSSTSSLESEKSSSDSEASHKKKKKKKGKKKLVSGRLQEIDKMDIVKVVKYPHAKLNPDFVKVRKFDSLPFHHLVAGELEIISRKTCSKEEREARQGILKYLAYHFSYLDTNELREQYDAIMKRVERGELSWSQNLPKKIHKSLAFRRHTIAADRKISDEQTRKGEISKEKKSKVDRKTQRENEEDVFYCADYNRGKCEFSTSHLGKWAGKDIMKLHICKKCLAEDGAKRAHPEGDEKCPKKA